MVTINKSCRHKLQITDTAQWSVEKFHHVGNCIDAFKRYKILIQTECLWSIFVTRDTFIQKISFDF